MLISPAEKVSEPPAVVILNLFIAPANDLEPAVLVARDKFERPSPALHTHVFVDEFSSVRTILP